MGDDNKLNNSINSRGYLVLVLVVLIVLYAMYKWDENRRTADQPFPPANTSTR